MCVRQRTRWISCKVRDADGSSTPFVIALKRSITDKVRPDFLFYKKKHTFSCSKPHITFYLGWFFIPFPEPTIWQWDSWYGTMFFPLFYQPLGNFNVFSSKFLRHILYLYGCILLIHIRNVRKWNEVLFSLTVSVSGVFLLVLFCFCLLFLRKFWTLTYLQICFQIPVINQPGNFFYFTWS
jgi:hypothetical protein